MNNKAEEIAPKGDNFNVLRQATVTVVSNDITWPTSLKTAGEMAATLGISEERLVHLADAGYAPHFRVDGGLPQFKATEVKHWAARNLLTENPGMDLQLSIRQVVEPPLAESMPAQLAEFTNLRELPAHGYAPGVYFLVHDARGIVYVGQSMNPAARVAEHARQPRNPNHYRKVFHRVFMVPVPAQDLDEVEGAFIRLFKPHYNQCETSTSKNGLVAPSDRGTDDKVITQYAPQLSKSTTPTGSSMNKKQETET